MYISALSVRHFLKRSLAGYYSDPKIVSHVSAVTQLEFKGSGASEVIDGLSTTSLSTVLTAVIATQGDDVISAGTYGPIETAAAALEYFTQLEGWGYELPKVDRDARKTLQKRVDADAKKAARA